MSKLINYKITIAYDGTNYKGWQVQNNTEDTIQGKIQNALTKLFDGEADSNNIVNGKTNLKSIADEKTDFSEINVIGSGRTDAGVHASGQVANFYIKSEAIGDMSDAEFLLAINSLLPRDIAVLTLERCDERFHARFLAIEKTYRYRIHVSPVSNVFEKRFVYTYLDYPLDVELMRAAAALMVGEKDFKAFCGNKHMKKSTVRNVSSIDVQEITDANGIREICIDYTGDGFLQNMVRIMTGTLIEVGSKRRSVESVIKTIESLDREKAGYTAPPQGLSLINVRYE